MAQFVTPHWATIRLVPYQTNTFRLKKKHDNLKLKFYFKEYTQTKTKSLLNVSFIASEI